MPLTLKLLIEVRGRLEIARARQRNHLIPELIRVEHLEETHPSETRTPVPLHRVVFRMARQLEHVFRQAERIAHSPHRHQIPTQPLIVVSKVVDLVRQHAVAHHVSVINPGRSFLLKTGIFESLQARVNVSRHVPHVCD